MNTQDTAPLSPSVSTEDTDMAKIREIFDRALNAIVQSTALAKQVEELTQSLNQLKAEVERVRRDNQWLDEQLVSIRGQRDDALRQAEAAKHDLQQVTQQKNYAEDQAKTFQDQLAHIREQLEQVKKERDDYGMKQMQTDEELKAANAKLADMKAFAQSAFGLQEPPKPRQDGVADNYKTPEPAPTQDYGNHGVSSEPIKPEPDPNLRNEPQGYRNW